LSGGFQVVISDLQDMASTFHTEARVFQAIMPESPGGIPDGGSAAFNESLDAVVQLATLAHLQIGADIGENGPKLQTAHDRYQYTKETLTQLARKVNPGALD
jgi:hypothetical protein